MPVSFVAGREDVINTLTPGSEGSTFGGYPLASVVGTYAIKVYSYSKKPKVAIEAAKRNAVHGIIFKGLAGGIAALLANEEFRNKLVEIIKPIGNPISTPTNIHSAVANIVVSFVK